MDGRRFPIEPWMGESENPHVATGRGGSRVGEGPFFGYFLWAPAKKVTRLQAKAFDLALRYRTTRGMKVDQQHHQLSPAASSFLLLSPKETEPKKRALPVRSVIPTDAVTQGSPDSPSWLGRATADIHVRRPPGLGDKS